MSAAIAVLGTIVAAQYMVIGVYVVPRLARLAEYRGTVIRMAQWGAAAFFIGCALTHVGVAVHAVTEPVQGESLHQFLVHVGPHIAQVVGGATFIVIAARKLDVRFTAKDDGTSDRDRARLAAIVHDSQDAILAIDTRRRITAWNPGAERLLGFTAKDVIGRPIHELVPAAQIEAHDAFTARVLKHGEPAHLEVSRRHRDGGLVDIALSVSPIRGPTGSVTGASAIMRDISERKREEARRAELMAELAEAQQRFRSAFEQAPTGVALVGVPEGTAGRILQANPALCGILGRDADSLTGMSCFELLHPDEHELMEAALGSVAAGESRELREETRFLRPDGTEVTVAVRGTAVGDREGRPRYLVCHLQDVTEERRQEAHLRHLANHDALTGLVNRRRFEEEVDRALAEGRRYEPSGALLVVDLDNFKYVNDTYGHPAGDRLLVAVSAAMRERLRDSDIIGRLGGDEFGVILPRTTAAEARATAADLLVAIKRDACVEVAGRSIRVSASVGVSPISGEGLSSAQLLAEADVAMYDAKQAGRDRASLSSGAEASMERMRKSFGWSQRVREALEHDRFELWEQPILDLRTGSCARSELLLRMRLGDQVIAPGEFLEVAERFGQIQAIDRWVVAQAVRLLAARCAAGEDHTVEVNLSGASITDEEVMDHITAEITRAPIDATRVVFEITETAAINNVERARRFARRLSDLGCQFALDDFGAGFGSFYYLKHLPFDAIKIDGDFIRELPASAADQATVKAIVDIARAFGKHTIAEAAGDEATLARLRGLGVDYAQGYHIARPSPARAAVPAPAA